MEKLHKAIIEGKLPIPPVGLKWGYDDEGVLILEPNRIVKEKVGLACYMRIDAKEGRPITLYYKERWAGEPLIDRITHFGFGIFLRDNGMRSFTETERGWVIHALQLGVPFTDCSLSDTDLFELSCIPGIDMVPGSVVLWNSNTIVGRVTNSPRLSVRITREYVIVCDFTSLTHTRALPMCPIRACKIFGPPVECVQKGGAGLRRAKFSWKLLGTK